MVHVNDGYLNLRAGYLFPEVARRTEAFLRAHRGADLIRLGIGDVTRPLVPSAVAALKEAADEMARAETFRGYGPERGYDFLIEKILAHDFAPRGVSLEPDEVFVSDGAKCDTANIQEIFSPDATVAVVDPVYPVYVDTTVMARRAGPPDAAGRYAGLTYIPATEENNFAPAPPEGLDADLVYLCSPNNPTGAVFDGKTLAAWVAWARERGAVLLFDAAYEAFIRDETLPHSIYEIDGAKECAIEFRSFSKTAGFTGLRLAYCVVPKALTGEGPDGGRVPLHALWNRRVGTKFNGASYPVQKAGAAVYSEAGRREVAANIAYYMENARVIREGLAEAGYRVFGGENAPYVWLRAPGGDSWAFFDRLLETCEVVGTPGAGFGPSGEGYFRLSAFGDAERTKEAVARIRTRLPA